MGVKGVALAALLVAILLPFGAADPIVDDLPLLVAGVIQPDEEAFAGAWDYPLQVALGCGDALNGWITEVSAGLLPGDVLEVSVIGSSASVRLSAGEPAAIIESNDYCSPAFRLSGQDLTAPAVFQLASYAADGMPS